MKRFKKLMALVIAVVMVLGMSTMAFAAADTQHTITVNNIDGDKETHSYEAYQVFAGDYDTETKTLSNVTWGAGVNGDALLTALKADSTVGSKFTNCTTAADVAKAMTDLTNDSDEMKAISKVVAANLSDTKAATGSSPLNVTGDGYYFVQDVTENLKEATKTNYIMQVCGDVEITAKSDVPSVVKKVKDVNDTEGTETEWQDSADYDIGDTIPYQITGTLPSNYATYDVYNYVFTDTMSKGLAYTAGNAKIYAINGEGDNQTKTDITSSFTETVGTADADGNVTVTWACTDLKSITGATIDKDTKIVVEYSCTLDDDAVLGSTGNPNTVTLQYSNNPNNGGKGTSETPEDKNIVFTYKVHVDKFKDEIKEGNELTGAGFTLYKEVPSTVTGAVKGDAITFGENVEHSAIDADKYYIAIANVDADSNGATFDFNGIDDGNYVLVETTVPAGYNAWKSTAVTVTAEHSDGDNPALTKLEGGDLLSGDVQTGVLDTDIVNESGTVLPSTGGMGTTIFYIIGAILVVGAGILLVTRRRMSANN